SATQQGGPMPGMDPTAGGGGAGAAQGGQGAIPPVQGMEGMMGAGAPGAGAQKAGAWNGNGHAYDAKGINRLGHDGVAFDSSGLLESGNKAAAIARMRKLAKAS